MADLGLLLVRHGLSEWNVAGRWQGWADIPLAGAGEAQLYGAVLPGACGKEGGERLADLADGVHEIVGDAGRPAVRLVRRRRRIGRRGRAVRFCARLRYRRVGARAGRHGLAYTRFGKLNMKNARHADDPRPLDEAISTAGGLRGARRARGSRRPSTRGPPRPPGSSRSTRPRPRRRRPGSRPSPSRSPSRPA